MPQKSQGMASCFVSGRSIIGRMGRSPAKMLPRKNGTTALFDVLAVEMAGDGGAKSLQGRGEVGSLTGGGRLSGERVCGDGGSA